MNLGDAGAAGRDAAYTTTLSKPVTDADRPSAKSTWSFLPNFFLTHDLVYDAQGTFKGGTVGPDFLKLGLAAGALFYFGKKVLKK